MQWVAPASCPSAAEMRARTLGALAQARGKWRQAHVVIEAESDGRFRARIDVETEHGSGTRVLEGATCAIVSEQALVVVSMSAAPSFPSSSASASTPPAQPLAEPPLKRAPAPATSVDRSLPPNPTTHDAVVPGERSSKGSGGPTLAIGAGALADAGTLPSVGMGIGGWIGFSPRSRVWLIGSGDLLASQTALFDSAGAGNEVGARFSSVSATVRGCYEIPLTSRSVFVVPCLGIRLDAVFGEGVGAVIVRSDSTVTWGPLAAVGLRVSLAKNLGLRFSVEGALPVARRPFVIAGWGELHRTSLVTGQASLGPEVLF